MQDNERIEFEKNLDAYWERVRDYLIGMGVHDADAKDLAQEVIMRVLQIWSQYESGSNLIAWLRKIAYYVGLQFVTRELARRNAMVSLSGSSEGGLDESDVRVVVVVAPDLPAERTAMAKTIFKLWQEALEELNEEQRQAVVLHIWGGRTYQEVSELLGIPGGTLATRYRRGLQQLRIIVEPRLAQLGLELEDMFIASEDWKFLGLSFR